MKTFELEDLSEELAKLDALEQASKAKLKEYRAKARAKMLPGEKTASNKKEYTRNREQRIAASKKWQKENPDKLAENRRKNKATPVKWLKDHPDAVKRYQQKYHKNRVMTPEQRERARAACRANYYKEKEKGLTEEQKEARKASSLRYYHRNKDK